MKWRLTFSIMMVSCTISSGQTYWNPDSTGYHYLSRGDNINQWLALAGTKVEVDRAAFFAGGGSIKWTIPPHSGTATLEFTFFDVDLRDRVIYTTCRRNNHPATIEASLIVSEGKGFRLPTPVNVNDQAAYLPVDVWQKRGQSAWLWPFGGATRADLRNVKKILFTAADAEVEQILWIDEIKYTRPRGPACIINFNHYRDNADSLLTPWLIAKGYRANIDFTFDYAEKRFAHNRANGGLWVRYVGLKRIAELVKQHGWSTTHHGAFYDDLRRLAKEQRLQLYSLEPFTQARFTTHWCFSIPMDWSTPEIFAEIQGLNRFYTIRNQWDKLPNELPIDNPWRLRFYRISSASAGPNLPGQPETLTQMRNRIYQVFIRKGLLILNFDSVVTTASPDYKDIEFSMLSDDQALIQYADSLGFAFLTFQDLFAPDPNYKQRVSSNHDYFSSGAGRFDTLRVLQNDLVPIQRSLRIAAIGNPSNGQALITTNQRAIVYIPKANFAGLDRFDYIATDGVLSDTATVFVTVSLATTAHEGETPTRFALEQNYPNPFNPTTLIRYSLPASSHVRLEIFDLAGRKITTLVENTQSAGTKTIRYNASAIRSGIYFYKLTAGDFVETKKMILMR